MAKYVFIRDSEPRESDEKHKKGDVVDISNQATIDRWVRRGAIEPFTSKSNSKEKSK